MKKVYLLLALILFSGIHLAAWAQDSILSGKLQDEAGAPVAYANVALLTATDTSLIAGDVTGADGKFSVKIPASGRYFLRFSAIGYADKKTAVFEVSGMNFSKNFGSIILEEEATTLEEVSVEALRPSIRQEADRVVVSVEGTALAAASTAYDVLARVPGVFIDQEGNIQLNGRSGVTVMIDDKLTYLSARDLRTMLEGMSAENLKNIEIISNPSAKYDAEGSSGILNINLKKNDQRGMNGSLHAGYNYNGKQHGYSGGGTINYKTGPWNTFLNLDFARRVGGREATFTRVFDGPQETTYFDKEASGNYLAQGPPAIRLGVDYQLTQSHSIGFMNYYNVSFA